MSNIDKDIEILEEKKKALDLHIDNYYKNDCETAICRTLVKERNAIENVLSELETYKKANDNLLVKNVELKIGLKTLEQSNKNLLAKKSELETYKKIAEKLAEEVKRDSVFYDSKGISSCDLSEEKYCKCSKHNNGANCKQCIIDWARKEVNK